jgi:hypothetical protein
MNEELEGLEAELMGLGANSSMIAQVRKSFAAREHVMYKRAFAETLTPNQKHFLSKVDKSTIGDATMEDVTFFARTQITGSSETNLVSDSTQKAEGKSNISQGEIPKGTNFSLGRIRLAYATHASFTDPSTVIYDNYGTIPVNVLNGRLQVKHTNTGKILVDLPTNIFFAQGSNANRTILPGLNDFVHPKAYKLVEGGSKLEIGLIYPGSLPANNHFIEIMFGGAGTRAK